MRKDERLSKMYKKLYSMEPFKFVGFGDSHMYGEKCDGYIQSYGNNGESWAYGLPQYEWWNSFANLTGKHLRSINPNVTFTASGFPGDRAWQGVTKVQSAVLDHEPDLVLMEFGINDCWSGVPISNFESDMQSLIDSITGIGATLILMTTMPVATTEQSYGFEGTLRTVKPYKDYIDSVRKLAEINNLVCVDCWEMFYQQFNRGFTGKEWIHDAPHPGELGHNMYFEMIRQSLFSNRVI